MILAERRQDLKGRFNQRLNPSSMQIAIQVLSILLTLHWVYSFRHSRSSKQAPVPLFLIPALTKATEHLISVSVEHIMRNNCKNETKQYLPQHNESNRMMATTKLVNGTLDIGLCVEHRMRKN